MNMCVNSNIYRVASLISASVCVCVWTREREIMGAFAKWGCVQKTLNYTVRLLETLWLFVRRVLSACQMAMKWTPN